MAVIAPVDEAGVVAAVADARAAGTALEVEGGGSRRGFGRPVQAAATLSLAELSGVTLYRPGELVIRARAGTPVETVAGTLAEQGQMLPFEPPDFRHLLGHADAEPTIGGLVAANLSGPARIARGALRDSLIGVRFVDGQGEVMRSGGRVMKNVTGLDLVKLTAGAHGTLGVITEATFKVLPQAQDELTLVVATDDAEAAGRIMRAAMASPFEVSGAAFLPVAGARRSSVASLAGMKSGITLLRLEQFSEFIAGRADRLIAHLEGIPIAHRLDREETRNAWAEIRDAVCLAEPRERAVWRISTRPTAGPALLDTLVADGGDGFLDWSGGLLWLAVDATNDAGAGRIRQALRGPGGHATLVRAPAPVRAAVDVFEPQSEAVMGLTRRLKASFDANRTLNPGRMYAGV